MFIRGEIASTTRFYNNRLPSIASTACSYKMFDRQNRERQEIRRNPQKHPSKDPYQSAEIPKQKYSHLQEKVNCLSPVISFLFGLVGWVELRLGPDQNRTYANWTNIEHLDAKSGNFRPLNPLRSALSGDFKKECVSPTKDIPASLSKDRRFSQGCP